LSVSIDPGDGGATRVEGGHPAIILTAGYIGSTLFGGIFVMAAFSTLASKVMSFFIAFGLLMPLIRIRDKLYAIGSLKDLSTYAYFRTIALTVFYECLLIGFWFIDHAYANSLPFIRATHAFPVPLYGGTAYL
jgi:hypothetical protein